MSKPKKSDSAAFTITSDKDEDDHKAIEALRASLTRLHAGIDIFSQRDFLIQDPNAIENAEGTGMPSWSVCLTSCVLTMKFSYRKNSPRK